MQAGSLTHRRSLFSTNKISNHHRVKTQTDCCKQNVFEQKKYVVKRPLKQKVMSQMDLKYFQNKTNKMIMLKKKPAQKSIFGQLNLHMPKFHKQNLTSVQIQHPLKQYINTFKHKNNQKKLVKKHKISCEDFIKLPFKFKNQKDSLRLSQKTQQSIQSNICHAHLQNKQKIHLHKIIDQIYKKIQKFKQVGYTQKKINQWIQKYCLYKRKYMINLLMISTNKHKFSQTYMDYFYDKDKQNVKKKLQTCMKKINGKQKFIDQYDLMEFSDYMEQILIQKNKIKIQQLRQSITQKLDKCFIYNRQKNQYQFGKKLHPPDIINFVTDMNQIELRNGRFQNISNFNRQYFNDLGSTQKDIRCKIYELISITQNKKSKKLQRKRSQKNISPILLQPKLIQSKSIQSKQFQNQNFKTSQFDNFNNDNNDKTIQIVEVFDNQQF